jgi:hypothetical protein
MHDNKHIPPLQKLLCALSHIFKICVSCGDDMYDAQNLLLAWGRTMRALGTESRMIVVRQRWAVVLCMVVCMLVGMTMRIVVRVIMAMIVRMMVVAIAAMRMRVRMFVMLFVGVDFSVCGAGVFEPETGDRIADNASQGAQLLQSIPRSVLEIGWERQEEAHGGALDQRQGGEENEDRDDTGCDRIPS